MLTRTGRGGVLSGGYLCDRPAAAAVDADETPQFVLTNRKNGIVVDSHGVEDHIQPGSGFRTIAVVTDKRVIVLVGDSEGDRELLLPFAEIEGVETTTSIRTGRLTLRRDGDSTWHLYTGTDGLDDVAEYLDDASQAWIHVENELDSVKQALVTATEHRDRGDYDAALESTRTARDRIETARASAFRFSTTRPGDALRRRVEPVEERCERTTAEIRVGRARRATDEGESRWREEDYEAAYEAYERAREEYDAALALDHTLLEGVEGIRTERDRLDDIVAQLCQSPLRKAVAADNEAADADDPEVAAERWRDAMRHYRATLELDWGAEDRRFAGDPAKIRDRLGTVAEYLTSARRNVATDAMRAGDWYRDAEQYPAALEAYEDAIDGFETALATAHDCYPDAVQHLEADLTAAEQRLERAEAMRDGETFDDHIEAAPEPNYAASGTLGDPADAGDADAAETGIDSEALQADDVEGASTATVEHLRALAGSMLTDLVVDALCETVWDASAAPDDDPFDAVASRADDTELGVVVHAPEGDVTAATVEEAAARRTGDVDAVLLVASGPLSEAASDRAADADVRVLDVAALAAIVEAQNVEIPVSTA
ncbi:hypothetical protein [Haloarcula marina]|uniref:hypothetical protein n=1 Tax=Haloarcula marina TaxID=2961574 RepID=UPI0020B670E3|nr:hypothetical protein [Halomicroarcula marina]